MTKTNTATVTRTETTTHTLRADAFRGLIKRISPAMCQDETRFHAAMAGALFAPGPAGGLRVSATDGHRLHILDLPWSGKVTTMIVPVRGLESAMLAVKALADHEPVTVAIADGQFGVRCNGAAVEIAEVKAQFPPCDRVIPTRCHTTVRIDRDAFRKIVRKAPQNGSGGIMLEVGPTELDERSLWVCQGDVPTEGTRGRAAVKATIEGRSIRIGISKAYLYDILTAMPKGDIVVEFTDELGPMKFTAPDFLGVIMPMRI